MMMMSKKMKTGGVHPSNFYDGEDVGVPRSKHQRLLEDYTGLHKETEAMKMKLQRENRRRLTLDAELRFLRRRYKQLMTIQFAKTPSEPNFARNKILSMQRETPSQQNLVRNRIPTIHGEPLLEQSLARSRTPVIHRETPFEQSLARNRVPAIETILKQSLARNKDPVMDREAQLKQVIARNKSPAIHSESVGVERNQGEVEAVLPNPHRVLDLNLMSNEDEIEEIQMLPVPPRTQKNSKKFYGARGDRHLPPLPPLPPLPSSSDMKLLVCRDNGKIMNPPEKRKISWQDPVALRV
ncbi:hypothetical protein GIB67_026310 [Kingdonia uniflora]|uniref:Uncharacterized protein n=1 Tax=Kingdonia uniflora TaxID=39325 RepID=A0A7J7N605_9MAGN|nr:hypothetical protein GIB67_026310 [Kingdonia uniflora]